MKKLHCLFWEFDLLNLLMSESLMIVRSVSHRDKG